MSQVYEPGMAIFNNPVMRDIAQKCDQKMAAHIQEILLKAQEQTQEET